MEETIICPKCGEKENYHINRDSKNEIENILCNQCGNVFQHKAKQDLEKANDVLKEHGIFMTNFISSADHSAVLMAMHNYRMQGRHFTEDEIRIMQEQHYEAGYKSALTDNNVD